MAPTAAPDQRRLYSWAPTVDTGRAQGTQPDEIFKTGTKWTPFGLRALGHAMSINVTTGGLTITASDLDFPYYDMSLGITRTFDAQEQHSQAVHLRAYPNTDPRPHFFANWSLQSEAQINLTWHSSFPEVSVVDGTGASRLFCREAPTFEIHLDDVSEIGAKLRAYGVPGKTLQGLNWNAAPGDLLLRTLRGPLMLLVGRCWPETLVDEADVRLWRFDPVSGAAARYTTEYSYQRLVIASGIREASVQTIVADVVDAMGHRLQFAPDAAAPPYHSYSLSDGSGRALGLSLNTAIAFLDGDAFGSVAHAYVVDQVVDRTRNSANKIAYAYVDNKLDAVTLPSQDGGPVRQIKYRYDSDGHLIGIVDPIGDQFTIDYMEDLLDGDERLVPRLKVRRVTDGEGNSVAYDYDHPNGKVTVTFQGTTGPQRTLQYSYFEDDVDTHQRFIASEAVSVSRGYSGSQSIETAYSYSQDGRFSLISVADPMGNSSAFEYNSWNQTTAVTDQAGQRREYTYDLIDSPSPTAPNRYDLLVSFQDNIDGAGIVFPATVRYTFQRYDGTTSPDPTDALQSTHRRASRTDELGRTWRYGYDDVANSFPTQPTSTTDPLSNVTKLTFNPIGAVTSQTSAVGVHESWTYNTQGLLTSSTDANGNSRTWQYDQGTLWPRTATDALGSGPGDPAHSVSYHWDNAGQVTSITDAVGAQIALAYYSSKRLKSVTAYDPAARTTIFTYDVDGTVSTITDPLGRTSTFLRDEAGRLYETYRGGAGSPSIQLTLDRAGRAIAVRDRNLQTTAMTYDPMGRVLTVAEPPWPAAKPTNAGKQVQIFYDRLGHRLKVADSQLAGPYLYVYDQSGAMTSRTDPWGLVLNYSFDGRALLSGVADPSGTIDLKFVRDAAGRRIAVTDSAYLDSSRNFNYRWSAGTATGNLYGVDVDTSGIATDLQYDADRQLTSVSHTHGKANIARFDYRYLADGQIGQITGDRVGQFSYDARKQLTSESDVGVQDRYDGAGNRLWRAATAPAANAVYDSDNRLISIGNMNFTYDNNGNMLSQTAPGTQVKLAWDSANRLALFDDGHNQISYLYDADGRLVQRQVGSGGKAAIERYVWANRIILSRTDSSGIPTDVYTWDDGGRLLRWRSSQLKHQPRGDAHSVYPLADGLGNVVRLVDWAGQTRATLDYDAWGGIAVTGPDDHDFLFTYRTTYQDPQTGMINFGARWYNPTLGRWMSQDPLLRALAIARADLLPGYSAIGNLYEYVGNSPLSSWDPTGLDGQSAVGPDYYSLAFSFGYFGGYAGVSVQWSNRGSGVLVSEGAGFGTPGPMLTFVGGYLHPVSNRPATNEEVLSLLEGWTGSTQLSPGGPVLGETVGASGRSTELGLGSPGFGKGVSYGMEVSWILDVPSWIENEILLSIASDWSG